MYIPESFQGLSDTGPVCQVDKQSSFWVATGFLPNSAGGVLVVQSPKFKTMEEAFDYSFDKFKAVRFISKVSFTLV